MNALGHAYVALHAVSGNRRLLITGALLPESSPFIPSNTFSWEEIHEGGEKLLAFLEKNYPEKRDLALGILSHSLKYGADGFNKEMEKFAGSRRREVLRKIVAGSGVDWGTAKNLLHSYLGGGLDCWIFKMRPDLVEEVKEVVKDIDTRETSQLLAACFGKNPEEVKEMVEKLFQGVYRREDLSSLDGLVQTWIRQAAGLRDVGPLDFSKTLELVQFGAMLLKDNWLTFLERVTDEVRQNLLLFCGESV